MSKQYVGYYVEFTDTHPVFGGITRVIRPGDTLEQATAYAEREVKYSQEYFGGIVTYKILKGE